MRALVQRVTSARVEVAGEEVGAIGLGLLVFLGFGRRDTGADRAWVLAKVAGLRIFEDGEGKMAFSVGDVGGSVLLVSQFTLYGDVLRGRRPSFDGAMQPADAERAYEAAVNEARAMGLVVQTGRFRADMRVTCDNQGPVTLWIDSEARAKARDG